MASVMMIRYVVPSTGLGILVGTLVGTIAAAIIGPLIIRLRGVYFAMVTIAFGQVFYFIAFRWNSVTGGDDGLIGWTRQPLHLGFATVDILQQSKRLLLSRAGAVRRRSRRDGVAAALAVRPHAHRDPRERAPRPLSRHSRSTRHIWMSWVISCGFVSLAGALYALLNNFVDPRALLLGPSPATS